MDDDDAGAWPLPLDEVVEGALERAGGVGDGDDDSACHWTITGPVVATWIIGRGIGSVRDVISLIAASFTLCRFACLSSHANSSIARSRSAAKVMRAYPYPGSRWSPLPPECALRGRATSRSPF